MSEKNYPIVAVAENATTTKAEPEPLNMAYAREALTAIQRLASDEVGGNLDAWANYLRIRQIQAFAEIALATTTPTSPDALNMAECRSALEAIADSARTGSIRTLPSANVILRTCEKALAAPARNCDIVPIEAPKASDMFHRERPLHGYDYETHDWLLAPATEKEGGAK